jgi:hypothetical protein
MTQVGWTVRLPEAGLPGLYCRDCAELLDLLRLSISCAECGERVEDDEVAEHDGWRYFLAPGGTLIPFCAECAEEEFGV